MINLFRRALNEDPLIPVDGLPRESAIQGGALGEAELFANSHLRVGQAHKSMDDVGDDLNHIVMLLMSKIRYPTLVSAQAVKVYVEQRPHSYGSYLKAYYERYGSDIGDLENRIKMGIASGWRPDVSASYGAVRWYHRPDAGANPQLATLYSVVIDKFLK